MVQDEHRTVLISSHQLSDLERFADHIGILADGRLVCEGSTADLVGRHRMVEFSLPVGGPLPEMPGFHVRRSHAGRTLAVVDLELHPTPTLEARGLSVHSQTELPLEEIFLAMTSTRKEAA